MRARACAASTFFIDTARTIEQATFTRAIHPTSDPRTTLLNTTAGTWLEITDNSTSRFYLEGPAMIDADGSYIRYNYGLNAVQIFARRGDSTPTRSIPYAFEPTSFDFIDRDSTGAMHMYSVGLEGPNDFGTVRLTSAHLAETRQTSDSTWDRPNTLCGGVIFSGDHYTTYSVSDVHISVATKCNNQHDIIVEAHVSGTHAYPGHSMENFDNNVTISMFYDHFTCNSYGPNHCIPVHNSLVSRRKARRSSEVLVVIEPDSLILSANVAYQRVNTTETNVGLAEHNDSVVVAWISNGNDSLAVLNNWDLPRNTTTELDTVGLNEPQTRSVEAGSYSDTASIISTGQGLALVRNVRFTEHLPNIESTARRSCE